jgi:hypothetical protein
MVELIKQWEEEDEHWLAAPAARIPRRRSISTRPVMVMRDRPPREMNRFTLGPGLGDASGLKGVPQAPRGANPFSPGLGDEPGPLRLYEPGPMGDVHCSVYRATWPDLGSRPRTRPGPKVPDQRAFFSTSECCCPKQKKPAIDPTTKRPGPSVHTQPLVFKGGCQLGPSWICSEFVYMLVYWQPFISLVVLRVLTSAPTRLAQLLRGWWTRCR